MILRKNITLILPIPDCLAPLLVRTALLCRRLRFGYRFRKIPLTKGKYAIVDPQDYNRLSKYNWHAVIAPNTCYAARSQTCKLTGQSTKIPMHRSIIPIPENMLCDHINHIGLDNRRANLRPATAAQNSWNRKKQSKPTSSKYKGVYQTISNTWSAKITVLGKRIHLGTFKTETAAARAYDSAAKTHFGPFAYTNFSHNKFPNLNQILTPVKAIPQLLLFLVCTIITLLRTIKPLPAIITPLRNIQTHTRKMYPFFKTFVKYCTFWAKSFIGISSISCSKSSFSFIRKHFYENHSCKKAQLLPRTPKRLMLHKWAVLTDLGNVRKKSLRNSAKGV